MILGTIGVLSAVIAAGIGAWAGSFGGYDWLWVLPVGFLGTFLALGLLVFLFAWIACALVDTGKPQEEDSPFYRGMTALLLETVMTLLRVRVELRGMEQLPRDGRFLLVCNHLDIMDPPVLLHCFRKSQLAFISKRENHTMFLVGKLMHKLQCQLINRENDREALKTILNCVRLIKEDEVSIAVFPEGYCSLDGKLHHFRSGAFKIAQKTGVPIVVCTLKNAQNLFHNLLRGKHTDVPVHLVKVISPEEYKGMTTIQISDMVYELMIADMGEEFRTVEA